MSKRKAKDRLLTKIDPRVLKLKPQATSQHVAENGTRVTTTIKPGCQPPVVPVVFGADALDFEDDHLEDGSSDDDVANEYHVTRVCALTVFMSRGSPSPG